MNRWARGSYVAVETNERESDLKRDWKGERRSGGESTEREGRRGLGFGENLKVRVMT